MAFSCFSKLPLELQQMITEFSATDDKPVNINLAGVAAKMSGNAKSSLLWTEGSHPSIHVYNPPQSHSRRSYERGPLALACTCTSLYRHGLRKFLQNNIFSVRDPAPLRIPTICGKLVLEQYPSLANIETLLFHSSGTISAMAYGVMKETQLHNFELYSHFFPGVKQIGVEFCIDGINYSSDRRHLAGLAFRTSGFHEFRVALGKALITSSYPFVTNEPKLQLGVSCYPELREIQCWACISKASTCEVELTLSNRIEDNDFYRQDINSWFAMRHQFYGGGYSHLELKDYTMDRLEALAQNELNKRVAAGTTTGRPPAWKLNDYKSLVLRWRRSILIAKREAEEERLRLMEEEKRKKMEHVRSFKRGGANWTPELEAERERKKVEREKKRAKKFSQLSYSNRDGIPQD